MASLRRHCARAVLRYRLGYRIATAAMRSAPRSLQMVSNACLVVTATLLYPTPGTGGVEWARVALSLIVHTGRCSHATALSILCDRRPRDLTCRRSS